jgi:ribosomal protein L16 Arg81 hydroxylase
VPGAEGPRIDFGLNEAEFSTKYFEQRPYLHRGGLHDRSLDWAELEAMLHTLEPTEAGVQLFSQGLVPSPTYTDTRAEFGLLRRRISKPHLYNHLSSGSTLVINRVENHSIHALRLCSEVRRFSGHPATSNLYVTFGGPGTFGKHWDTHDVFVLQLAGRKHWKVFEPTTPLPLNHQTSERSTTPCPARAVVDIALEEGDLLYIPRGWWHEVAPLDVASIHLSVGVYAVTAYDFIMWTLARELAEDNDLRAALCRTNPQTIRARLMELGRARDLRPAIDEFERHLAQRQSVETEWDLGRGGGGSDG